MIKGKKNIKISYLGGGRKNEKDGRRTILADEVSEVTGEIIKEK